jgi:hypothetical protein
MIPHQNFRRREEHQIETHGRERQGRKRGREGREAGQEERQHDRKRGRRPRREAA